MASLKAGVFPSPGGATTSVHSRGCWNHRVCESAQIWISSVIAAAQAPTIIASGKVRSNPVLAA
jgi:hypothetical protein